MTAKSNVERTIEVLKDIHNPEEPVVLHEVTDRHYQFQYTDGTVVRLSEAVLQSVHAATPAKAAKYLRAELDGEAQQPDTGEESASFPPYAPGRVEEGFGGTKPGTDPLTEGFGGTKPAANSLDEGFGGTKPAHVDVPLDEDEKKARKIK